MLLRDLPIIWFAFLLACQALRAGEPVLRVVRTAQQDKTLLQNGDFEQAAAGKLADWTAAPDGNFVVVGQGRNGSQALFCTNATDTQWSGASQTILLNRTNVAPLLIRGWSKAENVTGGSDNDYSLYVDVNYTDGSPLWGQTAKFQTGTHDWQKRELTILPAKPVRSLTLYCLLRRHSGRAWFDDLTLQEVDEQEGAVMFQGVPMAVSGAPTRRGGKTIMLSSGDGLILSLRGNEVRALSVDGRNLRSMAPSGFLARDAATGSDVYSFQDGECPELGLKLQTTWQAKGDHLAAEGRLSDLSGKDRAITLIFALPLDAEGWEWGDDGRRTRHIAGGGDFSNCEAIGCGATGTMSLYPLAPVFNTRTGMAVALDMGRPAQFRAGYHAGLKQLYIAYDFGLAPEPERFPRSADFRFVLFHFDPHWGFRGAFQKFTEVFPEFFRVRSKDQGIWMPFTDARTVEGWQDFGFKYHEGNNSVPWDDAHGILSFRYTEPMTWWMGMKKGTARTVAEAVRVRDEIAHGGDSQQARMAKVTVATAMCDESGQPGLIFRDEPWCDGAVWSLNPNPRLPAALGPGGSGQAQPAGALNAATVYWNDEIKRNLYGPSANGIQDGEYLDSLEGYVTSDLNYRREHFRHTTVPLCFDGDTRRPALYKGLGVYEFTKWLSADVHAMDKLMFANGVPYRFAWLCPWLDVLGTETDWLWQGKYRPPSDAQMSFWRTMSGQKPYLLLMNTDYNVFTAELVERYFQRSLFYGMFPSMFSQNAADNPYWQNARWYNRDRLLFVKYQPLIKKVAQAGWQPITYARCDNPQIWVERFGPDQQGATYFTVLNDSATLQAGVLRPDQKALGLELGAPATELVSNSAMRSTPMEWDIQLAPQQVKVIEARPAKSKAERN